MITIAYESDVFSHLSDAKLASLCKQATSQKEKAIMEAELYDRYLLSPASADLRHSRRDYLSKLLDCSPSNVDVRHGIYRLPGDVADFIWDQIDNHGFPLYTAQKVLHNARLDAKRNSVSMLVSLKKILAKNVENSFEIRTAQGKVFHRKRPSSLRNIQEAAANAEDDADPTESDSLWMSVRKAAAKEISTRLVNIDPAVSGALLKEFETDLNVLLDSFQSKLYRARRHSVRGSGPTVNSLTRTKVLQACRDLNMDPPKSHGDPIDMKMAGRQKRTLARLYHPDNHGGSDDQRNLYESVINAFDVLEQYMSTHSVECNPQ